MKYQPLSRQEIIDVIEGKGCASRVPVMLQFWTNVPAFGDRAAEVEKFIEDYPSDVQFLSLRMPDAFNAPDDDPNYRFANDEVKISNEKKGMDAQVVIEDYETQLDGILRDFPSPYYKNLTNVTVVDDGRYRVAHWWYLFFERHWSLRGMENALTDPYLYPDETKRLMSAVTDFYLVAIERAKKELKIDGIFFSDDYGTQTNCFFSKEVFREFYKPYWLRISAKCKELGIHIWLHTCGNVEEIFDDLIEAGVDVIHPIQKYTMEEKKIAEKYGDRVCIWAGLDVQQTIPYGTEEDVENEIKRLYRTYFREDGRFMFTFGNGLTKDCPVPLLKKAYETAYGFDVKAEYEREHGKDKK